MKQPLNEQFRRMQKIAGIITENQEPQLINESFEDLLQQLVTMAEKGEIGNEEIKNIEYELMSARRKGQSNARKASPDYAAKKAAAIAKAAITRDQNKKDSEVSLRKVKDKLAADRAEEEKRKVDTEKRRADNKLPLTLKVFVYGDDTEKALGKLAKNYTYFKIPAYGPGGQSEQGYNLKPELKNKSFDNAKIAWDIYDEQYLKN